MPAQKILLRSIAVGMALAGKSTRAISRVLHVPKSTVIFWLSKFQASNDVEDDVRSERPKATSSTADRRLIRLRKTNCFDSSMLLGEWGENVSARTVRNRLNAASLYSRRPVQKPKLSPCHVFTRLAWAMARCHFRQQQWSRIAFTDESRFRLFPTDGRVRVWRPPNERHSSSYTMDTVSYGGGSVHVWAAITRSSKSQLVILRQTVNKDSYKVVLKDYLLPWATANLGDSQRDWKLQDDNVPPHRARDVEEEKRRLGVRTIPWPSRSPDLNPIEHAWSMLSRRISRRTPRPWNLAQLATALKEEWQAIPQEKIAKLVDNMPRRINAVLKAKGGFTKY